MKITQDNYLDLQNLLVNELFGGPILFIIVATIIIAYHAIRYRIPIEAIIGLEILVIVFAISYTLFGWILVLSLVGFGVYALFSKTIKR